MSADILHLHTYFLFPFSIDRSAIMEDHPDIWRKNDQWFDRLDLWVTKHQMPEFETFVGQVSPWRRNSETQFDVSSAAYQDMVFFHPFIRRAFFDTRNQNAQREALVHNYCVDISAEARLFYAAEDARGGKAEVEVTSIRLMIFANGIGILIFGVEATDLSIAQALWINEMMRKIYPSSDRQIESGRVPNRLTLEVERDGERSVLLEETFAGSRLTAYRPRLSRVVLAFLYFANYTRQEFEPLLDERMIVNSYVKLNGALLPAHYARSEEYEIIFSRFLYVDREGEGYRYDPEFTQRQMKLQVYRRWQHEGTLYGATSYSNLTSTIYRSESSNANALVYRMFKSKNHLISLIGLFYRATLLDFAKESALVSRQLFPIFSGQVVRHSHIQLATKLMADFHYFNNYWFFDELTSKDEELEHFEMIAKAYRLREMKRNLGGQIDKLAGYIDRLYALRNSDAVNRLAMFSVILGVGALVTGFFGMNIPVLESLMKSDFVSRASFVATLLFTVFSLCFIIYIVASNWFAFRASLLPQRYRQSVEPNSMRELEDEAG